MSAARRLVATDLWTKPIGLNHKPACRLPVNYTHHRHFIITQPESWYSFCHPTEGRRLSRPSWLATYQDGLPARSTHTVIYPSTNRARSRVTSLIETNALPLSHATNCCHMGTAIKHPVPVWVKSSFVIFYIWALWHSGLSIRVPRCQKLQMTA